jgi:predicted ATPase/DNA-binding XRE family transcriptional regulator
LNQNTRCLNNAQSDTKSDTNDHPMMDEIIFSEWLRKQRRSLDLTQRALAAQVGCAEITLRRIEDGTLKPSKELALILLEKLGIPEMERSQWMLFARGLSGFPTSPIDSSASQPLTNLPASLTTFIGREKERAEIIKHIGKHRLITLAGPGGVGKTRLSIKVGEQVLGEYANGVWLAELAALNDPALLPQTVTAVFGIAAQSNTSHTEILINFLRAKTALLILDNCEHLLEACAQLVDTLLKNCPNLKILATSREPLGITGEAVFSVPSLGLPDLVQLLENFRGYESVRLFEERAQLAKMDFLLTLDNASSVAQICQRLDGIPLAIELAAAQVNMFSAEQMAVRLNESFNLLTGGSRTALPRQQTIRASIEWSWNLLSDSERILLRRLSVFAGGWVLESAEAVCSANGIEEKQVMELMAQLVKKSVVIANQEKGRGTRYYFHEMVRQYIDEKLVEADETETTHAQHLKYFLKLSEQIEPGLHSPQQVEWSARTYAELHNLRAALAWAVKTDVEAGLYVASNLGQFWISFQLNEGVHWLTEFLQNPISENYPQARAKATIIQRHVLADMEKYLPDYGAIEECLRFYRASGDQQGEIDSLLLLSRLVVGDRSSELIWQALTLARSIGDKWREARALGAHDWAHTDHKQALDSWKEAIALYRQVGDLRRLAVQQDITATYLVLDGDYESAKRLLEEASEINQLLNNKSITADILFTSGNMALMQGDYDQARTNFQQHMTIHAELGKDIDWSHSRLGCIALHEGKLTEAHQILAETVKKFYENGNQVGLVSTLEVLTSLYIKIGKPKSAVLLIGWVNRVREELGYARWRVEQDDVDRDIAACRLTLGEAAFSVAYNAGGSMTLEQAVVYALDRG